MATDLSAAILAAAQKPKSAESDGQHVEMHSLKEQIEADRYNESVKAAALPTFGMRFVKIVLPGSV